MRKIDVSGKVPSRIPFSAPRRLEVRPKRLFDDDAGAFGTARFAELFDDRSEQDRRYGKVVRRPLRGAELFADGRKGRGVFVVAIHVAQQAAELVESRPVDAAVLLEAVLRPRAKLFEVPAGLGHADDRHVEMAALHQRLQRGEDLFVSQIAGCAEEDEGIRLGIIHVCLFQQPVCRPVFPGVRQTDNASPTAVCPGSPPRRAS